MIPTGGTALAEARLMFALWVDSQRDVQRWFTREIARDEYHTDLDERLWSPLLERMHRAGLVEIYAEREDVAAMVLDHATMKQSIEQAFEADTLEASWRHERVLTDSQLKIEPMLATPNGWTLMVCDKWSGQRLLSLPPQTRKTGVANIVVAPIGSKAQQAEVKSSLFGKVIKWVSIGLGAIWTSFVFLSSNSPKDVADRVNGWTNLPVLRSVPASFFAFISSPWTLGLRLIQSQNAKAVASATPERKLAASLS